MPELPLVSIIVITYNSSKYVLETLESAKAQTYKNLELIVSDDCSTDNTAEICSTWIEENRHRFVRSKLIIANCNTGVTSNCNRGLAEAQGEWLKFIAGDDILTVGSIAGFVRCTQMNSDANFIFGAVIPFHGNTVYKPILAPKEFISATAQKQHKLLLKKDNCILGPASFIRRTIIQSLGGFDYRIPMQEDYPFWIKVTGLNHKLHFYEFNCAEYRIHNEGLTSSAMVNDGINPLFLESFSKTRSLVIIPHLLSSKLYMHYLHHRMFVWRNNKKGSGLNKILRYLSYILDPLGVYMKILNILNVKYGYHLKYVREK